MQLKHSKPEWLWLAFLALCVPLAVAAQQNTVPKELEQHVNTATEVFESMIKVDLPPEKRALLEKMN